MPVAIHERMHPFTSHEIEQEIGDKLYLFSDGMPDQFGSPKGKKFLHKFFKELLLKTAGLSIQEQGEAVAKAFDDWLSFEGQTYEQIDDVTIIGIEI